MLNLSLAAVFFLVIHLGVSGTRLRDAVTARIGEPVYMIAFSGGSLAGITWLAMAYNDASVSPANAVYWAAPLWVWHVGGLIMLLATLLVVIGISTNGPTAVQVGRKPDRLPDPRGIHRITRHPFLWGVLLWAAFHLAVNGDLASIILFGTFVILTAAGTRSIDAKRDRALGPVWAAYTAQSSNIPFAAAVKGQSVLRGLGEIAWWQWLAALAMYGALFYSHLWLFSASPVPGWTPY